MFIFSKVDSRFKINQYEVDIFIPELKLAIEFDGYYWHKDKEKIDRKKNSVLKIKKIKLVRVRESPLKRISKDDLVVAQNIFTKQDIDKIFNKINLLTKKKYNNEINKYLKKNFFCNDDIYRKYLSYFPSPFPENSLASTHKELCKEWDKIGNYPLTPKNFTYGSHMNIVWKCKNKKHPTFTQSIKSRTTKRGKKNRGDGCPYCGKSKFIFENSIAFLHPKIASEWHKQLNGDIKPEGISQNSGYAAWWKCSLKGCEYQKVVRHRTIKKQDCKICFGTKNKKKPKYNIYQIDKFDMGLNQLKKYLKKYKNIYGVSDKYIDKNGFKLGQWISHIHHRKDNQSQERIELLDSLDEWTWKIDKHERAFNIGVKNLKKYLKTNKNMDNITTNLVDDDGYNLGRWVSKTRAKKLIMKKNRIDTLELIKEWSWDNPRKAKNYYE